MIQTRQATWNESDGWLGLPPAEEAAEADLVFLFGAREHLERGQSHQQIASHFPNAIIAGCSTAGEICGTEASDATLIATAMSFHDTTVGSTSVDLSDYADSRAAGAALIQKLPSEGLRHVLVLSDGNVVNGSELVNGLRSAAPEGVQVTGGLAGDAERFERTLVVYGDQALPAQVIAVGFYGDNLRIGFGSLGGWDPFGPERLITRSDGNILYELDGRSALDLYRKYLGPYAQNLPTSSFLFPLGLRASEGEEGIVRTVLTIDEDRDAMIFAGDMPEGHYARLMKANFDRLIGGAELAAEHSSTGLSGRTADFALLISCVGRKIVLKQRVEEELEGVRRVLGDEAVLAGFYSYGEISPFSAETTCRLHNQTMTITTFVED
ncbi:MAG: FIST signal transduction protein [Thermoanaerobaculia bacterium]